MDRALRTSFATYYCKDVVLFKILKNNHKKYFKLILEINLFNFNFILSFLSGNIEVISLFHVWKKILHDMRIC